MPVQRQNLHNHSTHSDGRFSMSQLIQAAKEQRLEGIGISDHFFTGKVFRGLDFPSYLETRWPVYLDAIQTEKSNHHAPLKTWFGVEIDSCLDRIGTGLDALPWKDINTLDYVLIEYVGETDLGGLNLRQLSELRKLCKIPLILAHPNIELLSQDVSFSVVCEILRRNQICLEIPGGTRNKWYWTNRDSSPLKNVFLTIGTDTHENLEDVGKIDKALSFLEANHLTDRLADPDSLKLFLGGTP